MGFKKTSDLIAVSFRVTETAAGVLTELEVPLQLDVLNNEIAVVVAADIDLSSPDGIAATNTEVNGSITSTSAGAAVNTPGINDTNTIAVGEKAIRAAGFVDSGVGFQRAAQESYTGELDWIALIATNNFYAQIKGANNLTTKSMNGRLWLYRARADATTYAALVQSEVLSA